MIDKLVEITQKTVLTYLKLESNYGLPLTMYVESLERVDKVCPFVSCTPKKRLWKAGVEHLGVRALNRPNRFVALSLFTKIYSVQ